VPASGEEGAPVDEPQATAKSAAELRIDGFAIGTKFSDLMKRGALYDKPCDLDRLQEVGRSAVVYAGKECHDQVFPDGTTLLLLLALGPGDGEIGTDADLDQPIEAIGWIGGNYFSGKANFPSSSVRSGLKSTQHLGNQPSP
jgi:hypothetical protein